jgi:hypothetical protein
MGPQDKTIRIIIAVIIAVLFFTKAFGKFDFMRVPSPAASTMERQVRSVIVSSRMIEGFSAQ